MWFVANTQPHSCSLYSQALNLSLLSFVRELQEYVFLLSFATYSLFAFASLGNSVIIFLFLALRLLDESDDFLEQLWLFCGSIFHLVCGGIILSVGLIQELGSGNRISGYLNVLVGILMLVEPVLFIFKRKFWELK